jgi:hypothetical protein
LVPTPGFARGLHFDMGDLLTVQYNGTSLSMRLDVVEVSLQNGQWIEKASLRGVI